MFIHIQCTYSLCISMFIAQHIYVELIILLSLSKIQYSNKILIKIIDTQGSLKDNLQLSLIHGHIFSVITVIMVPSVHTPWQRLCKQMELCSFFCLARVFFTRSGSDSAAILKSLTTKSKIYLWRIYSVLGPN